MVPHRVRSGLVQSGVVDRGGRPPWIMWAHPDGDDVLLDLWLQAGATSEDLREAAPVIAAATGATRVDVGHRSARQDRAALVLQGPRWGWPGRSPGPVAGWRLSRPGYGSRSVTVARH